MPRTSRKMIKKSSQDKYILKGQEAIPCPDVLKWGQWLETADRTVAKDTVGDSDVGTVFLGLDHSFGEGPPLLFETMVFGGSLSDAMDRYSTWDEAVSGHNAMVCRLRGA